MPALFSDSSLPHCILRLHLMSAAGPYHTISSPHLGAATGTLDVSRFLPCVAVSTGAISLLHQSTDAEDDVLIDLSNVVPGHVVAYKDMEDDLLLTGDLN
jgi:hypothetical protein